MLCSNALCCFPDKFTSICIQNVFNFIFSPSLDTIFLLVKCLKEDLVSLLPHWVISTWMVLEV